MCIQFQLNTPLEVVFVYNISSTIVHTKDLNSYTARIPLVFLRVVDSTRVTTMAVIRPGIRSLCEHSQYGPPRVIMMQKLARPSGERGYSGPDCIW